MAFQIINELHQRKEILEYYEKIKSFNFLLNVIFYLLVVLNINLPQLND